MIYAGIGPRRTAGLELREAFECGRRLRAAGHTLRSGGADGADRAFVGGALAGVAPELARVEAYLPWPGASRWLPRELEPVLFEPDPEAFVIAERYHPAWEHCDRAARALLARSVHVLLGVNLDAPVDVIVTTAVTRRGGTANTLRVAAGECPEVPVVAASEWEGLL